MASRSGLDGGQEQESQEASGIAVDLGRVEDAIRNLLDEAT